MGYWQNIICWLWCICVRFPFCTDQTVVGREPFWCDCGNCYGMWFSFWFMILWQTCTVFQMGIAEGYLCLQFFDAVGWAAGRASGLQNIWSDEVLAWLSVWSKVQMICIWFSWCHSHPIISCFSKIQNSLSFWYRPTQVVLVCVCVCVCVCACVIAEGYTVGFVAWYFSAWIA